MIAINNEDKDLNLDNNEEIDLKNIFDYKSK